MAKENVTKADRRLQAREKTKNLRVAETKRTNRKKIAGWISGGLVTAAIAAAVAVSVVSSIQPAVPQTNPRNLASDGVILTSTMEATPTAARPVGDLREFTDESILPDRPHMKIYLDYSCIRCAEFEAENKDNLKTWLDEGSITLEIHPTAALGSPFSFRGANAAACVIDSVPETFFEFNSKVFAAEGAGTPQGIPEHKMQKIVDALDTSEENKTFIKNCISSNIFSEWVTESTATALQDSIDNTERTPLTGTPTVLIDGYAYPGSYKSDVFSSFVEEFINGNGPTTVTEAEASEKSPVQ